MDQTPIQILLKGQKLVRYKHYPGPSYNKVLWKTILWENNGDIFRFIKL